MPMEAQVRFSNSHDRPGVSQSGRISTSGSLLRPKYPEQTTNNRRCLCGLIHVNVNVMFFAKISTGASSTATVFTRALAKHAKLAHMLPELLSRRLQWKFWLLDIWMTSPEVVWRHVDFTWRIPRGGTGWRGEENVTRAPIDIALRGK